jgi:N utilization substance protein A
VVIEAIEAALVSAYRKTPNATGHNVTVELDREDYKPHVYAHKEVVEEVTDPRVQISLEEARKIDPQAELGSTVRIEVTPRNFGRIAAQTAKQVILQRIREAERELLYRTYKEREGEIVQGTVQALEPHMATIALDERVEAILPRKEQIPRERLRIGQRLRVYIVEVNKTNRGPEIIVSRTHRDMLRRLLELEVPEIFNGTVEIKAIAREAGSRSKVAVAARQEGVDPVGACVGLRGVRIQALVNELGGEKIDVIEWHPDPAIFIAKALSPAMVVSVTLEETPEGRTANVVVPDKQLSLAIGKEGQNARLAAKLTGWRIDIRSETEAAQEEARRAAEAARRAEEEKELEAAKALLAQAEAAAHEEAAPEVDEEAPPAVEEVVTEAPVEEAVAAEEAPIAEAAPEEATVPAEIEEPLPAEAVIEAVSEAAEEPEGVEEEPTFEEWEEVEYEEEEEALLVKGAKKKRKGRRLEYDPKLGRVVVRHERKPGRQKERWDVAVLLDEEEEEEDLFSIWDDDEEEER